MKAEHFIYGLFKGYGIKLIKSPSLNTLLTGEIIDYLCNLKESKEYSNLWPNGIITVSHVHATHDEYGRDGVWNHTIAFRLIDYLEFTQPALLLSDFLISNLEHPPEQLKPIIVKSEK